MKKILTGLLIVMVSGCGYATRGFIYDGNTIIVDPVVNKIDITSEQRRYSRYTSFPALIENRLTNVLIEKFNIDGGLKVVRQGSEALRLGCALTSYTKETMRYTDSDEVREQRLRLYIDITLYDAAGAVIKTGRVSGQASYFLSGPQQKSEEAAQQELIDDAARRILEAVVEEW